MPVLEWDLQKPEPIAALRYMYETGKMSLRGLLDMLGLPIGSMYKQRVIVIHTCMKSGRRCS